MFNKLYVKIKNFKNENDVNISKFNTDMKGRGNLPEVDLDDFIHIRNFIGFESLIIYIMEVGF